MKAPNLPVTDPPVIRPLLTLLAAITLTTVLGSIHAFSVFLQPLEKLLAADRAQISLIYSGALLCLTVSVLFGHRIYPRLPAAALALATCIAAAVGVAIAGQSQMLWLTALGYSVIFGSANGVGYGFALQISAQAMPTRRGLAMGTVTACYALGATLAPFVFGYALARGGIAAAMGTAALILLLAGVIAWVLLYQSRARFVPESSNAAVSTDNVHLQRLLWLGYGSGALAGLMVIGHATGIVRAAGGSASLAIGGAVVIAFGNMLGGLSAGVLADRVRIGTLLALLPLLSATVLVLCVLPWDARWLLAGLVVVGFSYGAIIALYPVAVIAHFGAQASSRVYGRVFTAWGLVGLLGPWLAGVLYDVTGGYTVAIVVAAVSSGFSVWVVRRMSVAG